jgi:acyl-coenzyme A synthetase/AMP-(fatty) acid ligase
MTDHDLSTSAELAAIRKSRTELRERWYREGWFRKESLAEAILRRAASQPPTELLLQTTEGLRRTDTAEILADGRRLAHGLREIGIRPGDTVAIQMPTRYEAAIIYMACLFAGATLLPIVHIYGPAEVSFILRRARARAIFVPDRWRKFDFLERMEEIGPLPDLEHVIVVGERIGRGMMDFRNLQARSTEILPPPPQDPDAPCLLMFTSGTTGEPKGVIQTHNTLRYEYETPFIELPGLFLNPAPAGHVQGFNFLMRPFFTGVPVLMMDGWDADLAAQLIAKYKPVQSGGAPLFPAHIAGGGQTRGLGYLLPAQLRHGCRSRDARTCLPGRTQWHPGWTLLRDDRTFHGLCLQDHHAPGTTRHHRWQAATEHRDTHR